jgi:hypothetical protein
MEIDRKLILGADPPAGYIEANHPQYGWGYYTPAEVESWGLSGTENYEARYLASQELSITESLNNPSGFPESFNLDRWRMIEELIKPVEFNNPSFSNIFGESSQLFGTQTGFWSGFNPFDDVPWQPFGKFFEGINPFDNTPWQGGQQIAGAIGQLLPLILIMTMGKGSNNMLPLLLLFSGGLNTNPIASPTSPAVESYA